MRVTVSEIDHKLVPSSPFTRSCRIELPNSTMRERTAVSYELFRWCAERWGETVTRDAARKGDFPPSIAWFQAKDRFWFRDDRNFFEFKMRWSSAEIDNLISADVP